MASFVVFGFAFLALVSQLILVNADVIATTCEKTLDKNVCQSTFAANPESKNADLNGLAIIALDAAIKQGKDIQFKILELSKISDKASNKRLADCSNNYQEAIVELGKSKQALESKSYSDVNALVSAAMTSGESCVDGFRELPGGSSPMEEMNDELKGICSIVLTIANQLGGKA